MLPVADYLYRSGKGVFYPPKTTKGKKKEGKCGEKGKKCGKKKGKKTKIKNLPKTYMKVKVSTSGCVIDGEKAQYKGYEYDSMGTLDRLNKKNIATGEETTINSSSSERRRYIVLGDYILLRKAKAKKKPGESKITLQLLNNKGKKIKDLYSYNVNYNE